jgi:hypothetical protein
VSTEERHVALPKLYGGPAYARPPAAVVAGPRPFDPDELPLEIFQTEDEHDAATFEARAYESSTDQPQLPGATQLDSLRARPFSLRGIAGRFLGGD